MTVPQDKNIALKEIEKKSKYKDLELEKQWNGHMKTVVIPVVVDALGTVKKGMVEKNESIRSSYYDWDSKDQHTGIGANPQKDA